MKFSIIVPVYNTEKYLRKCLDSIFKSSYKNYEVIIINDGTKDNSEKIINEYLKKYQNIKYIKQKNMGLSVSRNKGIKESTGDYLLFLDSDDYIDKDLLSTLNTLIKDEDVIRFGLREIYNDKEVNILEDGFNTIDGANAFKKITRYKYIEMAQIYAIKKDYIIDNNYTFEPGIYHEDFELMPRLIYNAKKVKSLSFIGYNYNIHENSIMSDKTKEDKKMQDILYAFSKNKEKIKNKKELSHFYATSVIIKYFSLDQKMQAKYKKQIKDLQVFDYLDTSNIKRKLNKLKYKTKFGG